MPTVRIDEAQRRLLELVEKARQGEDVVISHGDGTAVRLVPVLSAELDRQPRKGGGAKGRIHLRSDFDDPLHDFEPYT